MTAALTLVPLSLLTTIIQANPLLVTLGAALVYGEVVGWRRWSAIAIGLMGVLIVLRPFGTAFQPEAMLVVAGSGLYAFAREARLRRKAIPSTSF